MSTELKEVVKNVVEVKDVIVKSVTGTGSIARIAKEKGLNPQEVFVRINFEYKGKTFTVSNKLRFLGKEGYQMLTDAKEKSTPINISVETESGFFYIENTVALDDLFKEPVTTTDTRENIKSLSALL